MALRFFCDYCVPTSVTQCLANEGHDILSLDAYLEPNAPDSEVIEQAQRLSAILLTFDGDFSNIRDYPPENYVGIVAFQLKKTANVIPQMIELLGRHISSNPEMHQYAGKLLLVEPHRIRVIG